MGEKLDKRVVFSDQFVRDQKVDVVDPYLLCDPADKKRIPVPSGITLKPKSRLTSSGSRDGGTFLSRFRTGIKRG